MPKRIQLMEITFLIPNLYTATNSKMIFLIIKKKKKTLEKNQIVNKLREKKE